MGASERFFPGGARRGFSQIFFQGGSKSGEINFYPSKLKQQPFLANNFKIQRWQLPLCPPFPTPDAHDHMTSLETLRCETQHYKQSTMKPALPIPSKFHYLFLNKKHIQNTRYTAHCPARLFWRKQYSKRTFFLYTLCLTAQESGVILPVDCAEIAVESVEEVYVTPLFTAVFDS